MYTFEEIMDNALTSREEVEMISNAQIGAEQDIDAEAARIPAYVDVLVQHARYQAFMVKRNDPNTNPFGLR